MPAAAKPSGARTLSASPSKPRSRATWWIAGLLTALILLCYWQVWKFDFVNYDDTDYVSQNPWVQRGLSSEGAAWAFTTGHASNWHPLTWLSHMLDWKIYGNHAGGHHFTNVFFHIANTVLLFLFLRKMTGATWRSAFVSALFALHPLHVESVAWVSERKDVLSTFFGFISLWCYAHYGHARNASVSSDERSIANRQSPIAKASARVRQPPKIDESSLAAKPKNNWLSTIGYRLSPSTAYALALLFFAFSLMSKPMFVTMPFLLLLLDSWPLQRSSMFGISAPASGIRDKMAQKTPKVPFRRLLLEKLPFLLLTIGSCLVTFKVQSGKTMQALSNFGIADRICNALVAYVVYLGKMFWPTDLAFFYPLLGAPPVSHVIPAVSVLLLLSSIAVLTRKKMPYLIIGWLWYLGTLVPVIGFVHVGEQSHADRYTYFPLVGIFIALTWWLTNRVDITDGATAPFNTPKTTFRKSVYAAAVLLLLSLAFLSHRQAGFWRDSKTLLERALAVTENNFLAHNNYGVVLADNDKYDLAIEHYRQAIRIKPHYARAYSNLGAALSLSGKFTEAIPQLEKALSLRPNDAETHYNLAVTLAQLQNYIGTIEHCRAALAANPNYKVAHYDLGLALSLTGENREAVEHFREYLKAFPKDESAQKLLARTLQYLPAQK